MQCRSVFPNSKANFWFFWRWYDWVFYPRFDREQHWADIWDIRQVLIKIKHYANIEQTLGRYWGHLADIGKTLGRHWEDVGVLHISHKTFCTSHARYETQIRVTWNYSNNTNFPTYKYQRKNSLFLKLLKIPRNSEYRVLG